MNWRRVIPARLGGCPADWELSRAFVEGGHSEVAVHLSRCSRCTLEWDSLARASAATSELPVVKMTQDTRLLIEARLLGAAAERPRRAAAEPRAWPRAAALVLLTSAVAMGAVIVAHRRRARDGAVTALSSLASIRAVGAATFSRLQAPPDEIVRLDSGTLEITVAAPPQGRRFRIATDDAVVDASEGRFSIEAGARTLVAVRVFAGYAEVRASGGRAGLHAGDEWARASSHVGTSRAEEALRPRAEPTAAPRSGVLPARSVAAVDRDARSFTPKPAASPRLPATVAAPERASFERGWRLLRSGDPLHAAEAFRDVDTQPGGSSISEDALFWEAVSLARAGLALDARASLAAFIARYPRSARVGEASAMLGWMLLESGDAPGAHHAFERAATDRVDRVRASAQAGLARLPAP